MSHYVFIDDALEINEAYEIDNEEHRHLTKVLRAKEGDFVQLINGRGTLAKGRLISVEKAKSHVLIESIIENETTNGTSRRKSILAQAFPKLNKLDFIVEKGTELGIDTFYLFTGEKSEKKSLSESGLKRLKKIAISAMKQSKRLFLPKIEVFNSAHEIPVNNTNVYFGDIDSTTPFLTLLDTSNNASTELGSVTSNLFVRCI